MSGIFGVVSKKDCLDDLFYGVDYHSHMGTERAGLAVVRKNEYRRVIHDISRRQFKSRFFDELSGLHGHLGIGVISDRDPQPLVVGSRHGQFAIAVAGFIGNLKSLRSELYQHGQSLIEINNNRCNSVEVVSRFICQANTIIEGIKTVWSKIKGSSTIVILKKDEILAARDRFGYLPLVIGQKENSLAVASESCSLKNLGYKIVYYLAPGEIVLLRPNRFYIVQKGNSIMQICAFLWIYTGNPASTYEEINVENVRGQCGKYLALRDDIEADMVAGVPDSGTGHAVGYAIESGLPYQRPLIKYTAGWDRSYTPPDQSIRDKIAKMKLIAIEEIIRGNRIVLCEDSIVRGTQLKNETLRKLFDSGAREVHVRPACPPLMFPCKYALSTRKKEELGARKSIQEIEGKRLDNIEDYLDQKSEKYLKMVEWIRKDIGATTLRYQFLDDMVAAIGLPKKQLCLYCWIGQGL